MRNYSFLTTLCCLIAAQTFAANDVRITEFLTSNSRTVADEDGFFVDWVEIHNTTGTNINLLNWSLTDNPAQPNRWQFPATNINAGAYMIIFVDSKDRKVPGGTLHANFSLNADGEYLALVRPDGSIATQFPTTYPVPDEFVVQAQDISYGFGVLASNFTVVATNASVRVRIPNSNADGTNWQIAGFNDSGWTAGTNGVGYGTTNAFVADYGFAISGTTPLIHYRMDETSGTTAANIGSGAAAMNGTYNSTALGSSGPRPPAQNGFEPNNNAVTLNGSSSFVAGPSGFFSGRGAFTVGGWVNPAAAALAGSRVGLFGQNDCVEFGFSSGTTIELWTPGGGSIQVPYPHPANTWHHIVGVGDGSALRVYIDGQPAGSGGITTASYGSSTFNFNIGGGGIADGTGNFFTGQMDEVVGYHRALTPAEVFSLYQAGTNGQGVAAASFVRTDVGPAMSNVNASAYIRIPFNVSNPEVVSSLMLRVRHDDGFAAYLNGVLVARINANDPLVFSSAATNTHSPALVDTFTVGTNALQAGANILAIQGLNAAANDQDFLIVAEMIAVSLTDESAVPVFFTSPTPGQANGSGVANPGPAILSPNHTPNVPLDGQDIVVTTRIVRSFFPIANVTLRYRVMFGS
ncbi:MAG TPA: LamG-like jellyroll fold domain-containing protein, partial [Candidatus Acidoferrum sp.]|nr:LamG-like jellyroll fold domain-containing protein [Candidatus Acidoferrum sp.]